MKSGRPAAPAHGLRHLGTDIFVLIALVHRIVHIDTVEPSVLSEAVLFPGITPGAFCNIGLQGGLGVDLPELHLPVKVRLPLAVGLVGHYVWFVSAGKGVGGHPLSPFISIDGHTAENGFLPRFAAELNGPFGEEGEQDGVVLDPAGNRLICHSNTPFPAQKITGCAACLSLRRLYYKLRRFAGGIAGLVRKKIMHKGKTAGYPEGSR